LIRSAFLKLSFQFFAVLSFLDQHRRISAELFNPAPNTKHLPPPEQAPPGVFRIRPNTKPLPPSNNCDVGWTRARVYGNQKAIGPQVFFPALCTHIGKSAWVVKFGLHQPKIVRAAVKIDSSDFLTIYFPTLFS